MSDSDRFRRATRVSLGVLFVAAVLPYIGIFDAPFVFDDVKLVAENDLFRDVDENPALVWEILNIASRRWADEELRPNYRPLRFLSYLIDYRLTRWWYGIDVVDELPTFFFHLTNVLLHALNTLLVGALALALLRPFCGGDANDDNRDDNRERHRLLLLGCVSAGLFFAWHPIQTEAVTYVSGRRDVLSTFFFLLALWLSTRGLAARSLPMVALLVAPLCFVCGLLTKEMVVTLPPALLLVDLWRRAAPTVGRIALHVVLWIVAVTFAGLTVANKSLIAQTLVQDDEIVLLTACRYVMHYLGLLLLPLTQSVDYSFDAILPSRSFVDPWTTTPAVLITCLLVLGGLVALSIWWRRERDSCDAIVGLAGVGILWVIGTLVPVLQFVPIPERFAERFLYLPSLGVVLLASGIVVWIRKRDPIVSTATLVLVALTLLVASVRRNSDWQSPLTLWTAAAEAHPRCARAHLARGHALKGAGRAREAAHEYTRALEIFEERPTVSLHHGYILQALTFRGALYGALQPPDRDLLEQAVLDYRRVLGEKDTDGEAIADSPRHTAVHFDLAGFLLKLERFELAETEYRRVIAIGTPSGLVGAAHFYLGQIARQRGDTVVAIASFRKAFEVSPDAAPETYKIAVVLADLLIEVREFNTVEELISQALERGVRPPEKLHLLLRHAKARDRLGDLTGSIEIIEGVLREDEDYVPALITLAGIETNLGKFDVARWRYDRVLAHNPSEPQALAGLQKLRIQEKLSQKDPEARQVSFEEIEHKGREHLSKGELLAAREVFAKLLETAEKRSDRRYAIIARRELGELEERLGRTNVARQYLAQLLETTPDDAALLLRLGDLSLRPPLDRPAAARYYTRYLAALPAAEKPEARVYVNLATLVVPDEPTRALGYCRQAAELGFDGPALDSAKGYAFAGRKEWEKALDAFNRYLERAPESDEEGRERVRRFVNDTVLPNMLGTKG